MLERKVAMAQVAGDLDVHVNVLRGWVASDRVADEGPGVPRPSQGEGAAR